MKNITALLGFLCFFLLAQSQDLQKSRYFLQPTTLCPIDYSTLTSKGGLEANKSIAVIADKKDNTKNDTTFVNTIYSTKFFAFDIIQPLGSYYVIKQWGYRKSKSNAISLIDALKKNAKAGTTKQPFLSNQSFLTKNSTVMSGDTVFAVDQTDDYYLVTQSDILSKSKEFDNLANTWSLGVLILPAKIRPFSTSSGNFDFEAAFNFGLSLSFTLNYNWQKDKHTSLILYTGVTSIKIDSEQSGGTTSTQTNISAYTVGVGLMVEKGKVQISVLTGIDFPAGQTQQKWVYRNMPWLGIGLGFSLFKIQSSESTAPGKNSSTGG